METETKVLVWMLASCALCVHLTSGQYSLSYSIYEEQPQGTFVGDVMADAQLGERYDDLSGFTFLASAGEGKNGNLFSIDSSTSNITTAAVIDRDIICPNEETCQVQLIVSVNSESSLLELVGVDIEILDLNDNTPLFETKNVNIAISESSAVGTSLALKAATDPDGPPNGIASYTYSTETDAFILVYRDLSDDEVYIEQRSELDREVEDRYTIQVFVADGGSPPKTSSVQVEITVLDANDNAPRFEKEVYSVSIPEDEEPGSILTQVKANDLDKGENAEVIYTFSSRTANTYRAMFELNSTTGILTLLQPLDFETKTSYSLSVIADDVADGSSVGETIIQITVLDVNDETPSITVTFPDVVVAQNGTVLVDLEEDAAVGDTVFFFTVVDNDSGDRGKCNCTLRDAPQFTLSQRIVKGYRVSTTTLLDRETTPSFSFHIYCRDFGSPVLASRTDIHVTLLDVNDNSPIFVQAAYLSGLAVNSSAGTYVTSVSATDRDHGDNAVIQYSLTRTPGSYFAINKDSGNITLDTALTFDGAVPDWVNFSAIATDRGDPPKSSSVQVAVNILEYHEQIPHFTRSVYDFSLQENLAVNTFVGSVSLTNIKYDTFSPFNFVLADSVSHSNNFYIDKYSGNLRTARTLDREKKDIYNLAVIASVSGSGLSSTAQIIVSVTDENDNVPEFTFPSLTNNTLYVTKTTKPKRVIGRIQARDADFGINGVVQYSIFSGDPDNIFSIDEGNGDIVLERDLRSMETQRINLQVKAKDNGTPQLTQETTLHLIIREPEEDDKLILILGVALGVGLVFIILIVVIVVVLRKQRKTAKKCKKVEKMLDEKIKNLESSEHNTSEQLADMSEDSIGGDVNRHQVMVLEDHKRNSFSQLGYLGDRDSDSGCSTDLSHSDSARSNGAYAVTSAQSLNGGSQLTSLHGPGSLWDTHIPEDAPYQHQLHPFGRHQTYRMARTPMVAPVTRSLSEPAVREGPASFAISNYANSSVNPGVRPADLSFNARQQPHALSPDEVTIEEHNAMKHRHNQVHHVHQPRDQDLRRDDVITSYSETELHKRKHVPVFPKTQLSQQRAALNRRSSLGTGPPEDIYGKKIKISDDEYEGHRSDTAVMATRMTPFVRKQLVGKKNKKPLSVHFSNPVDPKFGFVAEPPGFRNLVGKGSESVHSRQSSDTSSNLSMQPMQSSGRLSNAVLNLDDHIYTEHEVQV